MADAAARSRDKERERDRTPQSTQSSKSKVARSNKIAPLSSSSTPSQSPTEFRAQPAGSYDDVTADRSPPLPRSHTPGHLSVKSQDRRRKPSELSIRQRSQSAAATANPQTLSASQVSFSVPSSAKSTPGPSSAPALRNNASNGAESGTETTGRERQDSSAGSATGSGGVKRPSAMRSTSAIASKSSSAERSVPSSAVSRTSRTAPSSARRLHSSFPPLADPRTAPDVLPAPSSGMYWSHAPVSGSPHTALRAHTTTLVGSNVYVFGGCDSRTCFNELYVLDADSFYWSTPHVVGDIPMPLRAMTCTAVGKKLFIFGGGDGPTYYNDVYVLDTVNFRWSKPRILGDALPSKRRAHTACLYKNGIYVFGGGDGVRALNDIWRLDVSDINKMSWKLISESSDPELSPGPSKELVPKARGYHTANMVGSKLIIFGGSDGGECFNDVWVYDVEKHVWKKVSIPSAFRRLSHTATIVGSYLFVIGGHDGNEYSNDVLLLNLVTMTWDKRRVYGLPPSGRGYHGTVLYDSRLLVIGGFDGSEVFGDVWLLELAVHAYYSQISHFTIEV
ncbi:galactose oxidase [Thozetella sp. PMI_491]|nr:galactose oxidase [Thozetella sp. PMI_491]